MNPIMEEPNVEPLSFAEFLRESGLETLVTRQYMVGSFIASGDPTGQGTAGDTSPQSSGSTDTVRRTKQLNEFRLRQQEVLSRLKPRTVAPATKNSALPTQDEEENTDGGLVAVANAVEPEMIAVAKIGGSYEQKGRTREILGRAAKGGPRVSLTDMQRLETEIQLQLTIPGVPKITDGITDLLVRTEMYIRYLQEQFELSDEELAAQDYFILPPDATLEEWIKWATNEKDELVTRKFLKRLKNFAARFYRYIEETQNHLRAVGEGDLADEVAAGWQDLMERNLFKKFNTKILFTKKGFCGVSICEFDGEFRCKGAPGLCCVWEHHQVQPRRSIQEFKELKIMELDHVESIGLIGSALLSTAAEQLRAPNFDTIGALLFGPSNLRLVYRIGCHQTKNRKVDMEMLQNAIVTGHG